MRGAERRGKDQHPANVGAPNEDALLVSAAVGMKEGAAVLGTAVLGAAVGMEEGAAVLGAAVLGAAVGMEEAWKMLLVNNARPRWCAVSC